MMDSTLAQLLNHVYELELENVQLKQELEILRRQSASQVAEVGGTPPPTDSPAFLSMVGRE